MRKRNKKEKYFFSHLKWFFREIMKIYSTNSSYFSKKRIESGIGFIIAEWGMIYFILYKIDVMTTTDFAIWASIQFVVAGYMVTQIQKEKINSDTELLEASEDSYEEEEDITEDNSPCCCKCCK